MTKAEIRKEMLQKRKAVQPEEKERAAREVAGRLLNLPAYETAKTVMLYMDYKNEMPTLDLLEACYMDEKQVILPYTDDAFVVTAYAIKPESLRQLLRFLVAQKEAAGKGIAMEKTVPMGFRISPLGIPEPDPAACEKADLSAIDLVVIPGVAFDENCNRIGFGKGCYDRFLPSVNPAVIKAGICYEFQVSDIPIPSENTDFKMDYVLTDKRKIILDNK